MSTGKVRPHARFRTLLLGGLAWVLAAASPGAVHGQCPKPTSAGWQKDTTIKYRIDPNITGPEREAIQRSIQKWRDENQANGSGVRFEEMAPTDTSTPNLVLRNGQNAPVTRNGQTFIPPGNMHPEALNSDGSLARATITFDTRPEAGTDPTRAGYDTIWDKISLHELGHTMGLDHPDFSEETAGRTVMNSAANVNDQLNNIPTTLQPCDRTAIQSHPQYASSPGGGGDPCNGDPCCGDFCCGDPCCYDQCCQCAMQGFACATGGGCNGSPILIDVDGDGFDLTSGADGVFFDLNSDGTPEKIAWTSPGSDEVFLVLDRNGNGNVDNGRELFGNFTPQPSLTDRNGFTALGVCDEPEHGGNSDSVVDRRDPMFRQLLLWRDVNHNGVSEPGELYAPALLGLESFSLDFKESKRTDEHGNQFRYRAKVQDVRHSRVGRWAWDVFFAPGPKSASSLDAIFGGTAGAQGTRSCPARRSAAPSPSWH